MTTAWRRRRATSRPTPASDIFFCRHFVWRATMIFLLVRAYPAATTGASEPSASNAGDDDAEADANSLKDSVDVKEGISICDYFSLTLDYKEMGSITSPDFPNHYSNHSQCSMLLSACPLCRIRIKVKVLQLVNCDKKKNRGSKPQSKKEPGVPKKKPTCQTNCDFLLVEDPHYSILGDSYVILQGSGGGPYEYTSISNDVRVIFCGTSNYVAPKRFQVAYEVIDFKVANVTGAPNARGVLASPNFPETHISPHTYYYHLTNADAAGRIRLTFDDFDIHSESKIVVLDGDSTTSFFSWSQRPVYESTSRRLRINYISSMEFWDKLDVWEVRTGFKLTYEFVAADDSWDVKPDTGCDATEKDGGLLVLHSSLRLGGGAGAAAADTPSAAAISAAAGGNVASWRALDCIWVIKPSTYDNAVYAKLLQLKSAVTSSFNRLDIREGVNSVAPLLLHLHDSLGYPADGANGGIPVEFVSKTGFYIRLSMVYSKLDLFEMVYTGFHNQTKGGTCPFRRGFPCSNGRCINEDLRCDSYDHCGDGSDESEDAKCFRVNVGGKKTTKPPKPTQKPTKPTKTDKNKPTKSPKTTTTTTTTTTESQRSGNMRMNSSTGVGGTGAGGVKTDAGGFFGGAFDKSMGMAIGITLGSAIIIVVIATLVIVVGRTKYRHLQSQWQLAERLRRRHRTQSGGSSTAPSTATTARTSSAASRASAASAASMRRRKPRTKKLKKMRKSKKEKGGGGGGGGQALPPTYLEAISSPPFPAQCATDASTSSAPEPTTSTGVPASSSGISPSLTLPPPAYQPSDSDTDTQVPPPPPPRPHLHLKPPPSKSSLSAPSTSAFRSKSLPAPAPPSSGRIETRGAEAGISSPSGSGRGETTITLQGARPRPPERSGGAAVKKGVAFQLSPGRGKSRHPLTPSASYPMTRLPCPDEIRPVPFEQRSSHFDALPSVSEESDCEVFEILRRPPRFDPLEVLPPLSREERSVIRSTSLETVQEDPDNSTSYL